MESITPLWFAVLLLAGVAVVPVRGADPTTVGSAWSAAGPDSAGRAPSGPGTDSTGSALREPGSSSVGRALNEPGADTVGGTLGIYVENDSFTGTDHYYTSGVKLSWTSRDLSRLEGTPYASSLLPVFNLIPHIHDTAYQKNVIFSIGQNIYTPDNTKISAPQPNDRPYAGWLYASNGVVWKTDKVRNVLVMNLGVVGPWSYAQEAQRLVHDILGFGHPNGWANQLHNELGVTLAYERTWRWPHLVRRSGLEWEFLPHAGATGGNVMDFENLGGELRFGLNLPDDYGVATIGPASSTSTPVDGVMGAGRSWFPIGVHAFTRVDGRAVGHDIFLDGNTFGHSQSVGHNPFVADLTAGFTLNYKNTKLAYAVVYRTKEFRAQQQGQFFGTVSLNWTF
jgi:lipid A 3-O-deacylase